MFDLAHYSAKSKSYNNSNPLVVGKTTDETGDFLIKKFATLKPKMYLFLVDGSIENKKAKGVNNS